MPNTMERVAAAVPAYPGNSARQQAAAHRRARAALREVRDEARRLGGGGDWLG